MRRAGRRESSGVDPPGGRGGRIRYLVLVGARRDDDPAQWYAIGALAQVHRLVRLHDGTLRIALQAFDRVVIDRVTQQEPYLRVQGTVYRIISITPA